MPKTKAPAKTKPTKRTDMQVLKDQVEHLLQEVQRIHNENFMKDMRIDLLKETIDELQSKKRKFSIKNLFKWR